MDHPRPRTVWAAVTAVTLAAGGVVLTASWSQSPAFADTPAAVAATTTTPAPVVDPGPVQAGDVDPDLNPGILAPRARAEREPLRSAPPGAAADGGPGSSLNQDLAPQGEDAAAGESRAGESRADASDDGEPRGVSALATPDPADVREHAAEVLASLPGGDAVDIAWNHPDIGNHLGGVRLDAPTVMMLNSHRFEAEPEGVTSTVMHEIGHYYQGAVIADRAGAAGGWWNAYWELDAALGAEFGSKWMERSADCVALHLGATWTHYTDDCSGAGKQAAVEALVARQMP